MLLLDEEGRVIECNRGFERIVGGGCASMLGQIAWEAVSRFIPPETAARLGDFLREAFAGTSPESLSGPIEASFVLPTGEIRHVRQLLHPIRAGGAPLFALILTDVTGLKKAEEELVRSSAQLEEACRLARIGHWEIDRAQGAVRCTDEVCRILGFEPGAASLDLEAFLGFASPADRERVRGAFRGCREGGPCPSIEFSLIRADGTAGVVVAVPRASRGPDGSVRLEGSLQDVSEHRQMEAALRRSEEQLLEAQKLEAVGRLAGGIAHDFNNLLTVIRGYCEMAMEDAPQGTLHREDIEEIKRATTRASELTAQLLAFSRKQILQPKVIDLSEFLAGMEETLRSTLGEGIEISIACPPGLWPLKADPCQLERVMKKLGANAREAMSGGGTLSIRCANVELGHAFEYLPRGLEQGEHVMISVSDTGCGMDAETVSHIFEPFFTTKEGGRGTGLGLSTVYGIVEQSGGRIFPTSEPGKGTSFVMYFPRSPR